MNVFSSFVLRRAGWIAWIGTLLGIVGGYYSVQLYQNLRTDLEELLPTTARSVLDLNEVTRRLESVENLAILVMSKDTKASRRFVTDLAQRLAKGPPELIASVEYRIDKELAFFQKRRALYMELDDLIRIRDYIRDRIDYEKALYNPLNIFSGVEIPEPRLDFLGMEKKYASRAGTYTRFPDGYYATPDETKRVIIVNMAGKMAGLTAIVKLKDIVDREIAALKPESYSPEMEIRFTGGVQNSYEEQTALMSDLGMSSVIVFLLVSLGLFIYFKAFRATCALLGSLMIGVLWTFGVSYHVVGYLNANSAFLGSIIIGNGINFAIIFLARYLEERRAGRNNLRATRLSMGHTATATWTAALAAGLSYGSLMLTSFRGFKQFGVIGLIGMVFCWISAFTVMPAYLTILDRWKPLATKTRAKPRAPIAGLAAGLVDRHPKKIWAFSFMLTLVSLATFVRYDAGIIETNLAKLRNKESMERGSGYLSFFVDEIFQRFLSPVVLLAPSREEGREMASRLKKIREKEGKNTLYASVQTLDDFIPEQQEQKIRVLREIRTLLPPRLLRQLSPEDKTRVAEFLREDAFHPIRTEDLPPLVLEKFTEKDGSIGKMVVVEPPLNRAVLDGRNLQKFIHGLREVADSVAPGTPVAGGLPISSDMLESIERDGPKATLFAFLAVVVLVVFLFRNGKTIGLVLFSLVLGVVWMAGAILGFGIKINFLSFIALPITFGIGVDYGVNIFQRFREEGSGSILRVIRETGGAVGLCSYTTIVGYGSLLLAQNQAFVSFGFLAVLGELTCVVAAIFALPAYLMIRDRRQKR